jgi:hypothetical protein
MCDSNIPECPICLDDLSCEPVAVLGSCCHKFHVSCLEGWFTKKNKLICPICNEESLGYYKLHHGAKISELITKAHSSTSISISTSKTSPTSSESSDSENSHSPTYRERTYSIRNLSDIITNSGGTRRDGGRHLADMITRIRQQRRNTGDTYLPNLRYLHQNSSFYLAGESDSTRSRALQPGCPRYSADSLSTVSLSSDRLSVDPTPPLPPTQPQYTKDQTTRCGCCIQ